MDRHDLGTYVIISAALLALIVPLSLLVLSVGTPHYEQITVTDRAANDIRDQLGRTWTLPKDVAPFDDRRIVPGAVLDIEWRGLRTEPGDRDHIWRLKLVEE